MTGARRIGLVSDFILSVLVAIGIVVIALGVASWLTIRRVREEEARSK